MSLEEIIAVLEYDVKHIGLPMDIYPQLRELTVRAFYCGFIFYTNNVRAVYAPFNPFGSKKNDFSLKFPRRELGRIKRYGRSGKPASDQCKLLDQYLAHSAIPTDYLENSRTLMVDSFIGGFNLAKSNWEPYHGTTPEGMTGIFWRSKYDAQDLKNRLCAYAGISAK